MLAGYQGLSVAVEGYADSAATEREDADRAEEVAALLRASGLRVAAQNMGTRRPMGTGRLENSRVEIVVSGDALGSTATWDRPYSLSLQRESESRGTNREH
jgi:outer membrane protein OmpA-like peptidoglycan-associated protein